MLVGESVTWRGAEEKADMILLVRSDEETTEELRKLVINCLFVQYGETGREFCTRGVAVIVFTTGLADDRSCQGS